MFFRKNIEVRCPLPEAHQKWMEEAFAWLVKTFGQEQIKAVKVLIPHHSNFPIRYNGELQTAQDTLAIVARNMNVDPLQIHLEFYQAGVQQVGSGDLFGSGLLMEAEKDSEQGSNLPVSKEEDGKYYILMERKTLTSPERMVALLAHELSRIKLADQGWESEDNDRLADLIALSSGLGVFMANAAFELYQRQRLSWDYSKIGSLSQMEWGYGLALFAQFRNEPEPAWAKYLTPNVQSDLKKSTDYLRSRKAN